MKQFWAFVRKEIWHIQRDRRTLLILFGMPIVQVLLFGYAITTEFRGAKFAVLNHAGDQMSQELIQKFQASGHFSLVENAQNTDQIEKALKSNDIKLALIIPESFEQKINQSTENTVVQLITDGSDPNSATILTNYAQMIMMQFQKEQGLAAPLTLNVLTKMVYNPELKSVYMFVPGVITFILLLISAMLTSLTIAREKELGTMELLLVSPLHPMLLILGKVFPYIILSLINMLTILALGYYVFHVPILGSFWLLMALSLVFILMSLSLGIFISTKTKDQQTAMLISLMALMMPTMILSGFIFPIESMPPFLQGLSHIIVGKYFIIILKDIMLKGSGMAYLWNETLILFGVAIFFMVMSAKNFKVRLE